MLAWAGGLAIAWLTGATAVLIVLAVGLGTAAVAVPGGRRLVRSTSIESVTLPVESTAGVGVAMHVGALMPDDRPVWLDVRLGDTQVAGGWVGTPLVATFPRRGEVTQLTVTMRAAGALGLVWWRRTVPVDVAAHVVAPRAAPGSVTVTRRDGADDGERAPGRSGAIAGDTDGVRPWRDGDSERAVHWASSLRAGELVVHDRRLPTDRTTVVRAAVGTTDHDAAAGAALAALTAALAAGEDVWAAAGAGEPEPIGDRRVAARWAATVSLGPTEHPAPRPSWLQTDVLAWLRRPVEPDQVARASARWWAAAATLAALLMLAGSLGYGAGAHALAAVGVGLGAAVSTRTLRRGGEPPGWVRALAGAGALAAVGVVAAGAGALDGLLAVLRGPLPQLLMVLIVLHGFECRDRRTIRVALAIAAVVVMYAAGFRVDRSLGVWLAAWMLCCSVALVLLAGPAETRRPIRWTPGRAWVRPAVSLGLAAAAALGLLAVVPVPDGPAQLTLPTVIADRVPVGAPGALAGPDGALRPGGDTGGDERGRLSPSDYTGFAESLDTNVRGELGDSVVMRVRAGQPDFWRGQTFAQFDGRVWHADQGRGVSLGGPNVVVPPAFGDPAPDFGRFQLEPAEFTQTYFVEQDQPNLLYHAYQASRVVVDADVWARPDGALRSSTVLPAGSVYTVVSQRRPVTADWLREAGDVAARLTPVGRDAFARYLDVPASTSAETRQLADRLAAGLAPGRDSTYDLVRAYEDWIDRHVAYDLNGPLPRDGDDAVHDLLFGSRRGFCEQIASALVVMLRTQGVPARLATGYTAGRRDPVAGVWEVRASDAHAWTEVWFPEVGWQAFDPTAGVPLAGDTSAGTIGTGVVTGLARWAAAHPLQLAVVVAVPIAAAALWRLVAELVRRRRRGRWGVLQDRFTALAGAPAGVTNRVRAASWTDTDDSAVAQLVAEQLDAVAFDPNWHDDDTTFATTRQRIATLHRQQPPQGG